MNCWKKRIEIAANILTDFEPNKTQGDFQRQKSPHLRALVQLALLDDARRRGQSEVIMIMIDYACYFDTLRPLSLVRKMRKEKSVRKQNDSAGG